MPTKHMKLAKPAQKHYSVPAYRYTPEIQEGLHAKTKAEPWLHIGIRPVNTGKTMAIVYCIWIWDTRKVLETGVVDMKHCRQLVRVSHGPGHVTVKSGPALDNGEPVQGTDYIAKAFAEAMKTCKEGIYASPEFDIEQLQKDIK